MAAMIMVTACSMRYIGKPMGVVRPDHRINRIPSKTWISMLVVKMLNMRRSGKLNARLRSHSTRKKTAATSVTTTSTQRQAECRIVRMRVMSMS